MTDAQITFKTFTTLGAMVEFINEISWQFVLETHVGADGGGWWGVVFYFES